MSDTDWFNIIARIETFSWGKISKKYLMTFQFESNKWNLQGEKSHTEQRF